MKVRLDSSICSNPIELGDLIINDINTYILINTDPITLMDLEECGLTQRSLFTYTFDNFEGLHSWIKQFNYKVFSKNKFELQLVEKER
jgi:hypothetical protein